MYLKKISVGWTIVLFFSFLPLIPWLFTIQPIALRFSNVYNSFTSIGQLLGLIGTVMFSCNLILSMRLKVFENLFGGMNRVYVAHHILGSVAFLLLLFHPLALAVRFTPYSVKAAALYLLPGSDWSINFGISALLLMMSLLIFTFFINIPYQVWKFTHQFMGMAFLLAAIHGFYVSGSDISQDIFLKIYILIFVLVGLAAFTYRTLLGRFLVKKFKYSVSTVNMLKNDIFEVVLVPINKKMIYTPGQFIFLKFKSIGVSDETHPFSISSTDTDNNLTVTVKAEGDYTKALMNLKTGDIASVEGSFGRFSYKRADNKRQIWIAGGIGITPFISMARSVIDASFMIDMYYTVRTPGEAIYLDTLNKLYQANKNFRVFPFYTKTQGRLTAEVIAKTSEDVINTDIFVCGPPPMMHSLREQFQKLGVRNQQIHTEEFALR